MSSRRHWVGKLSGALRSGAAVVAACVLGSGCTPRAPYVWVEEVPQVQGEEVVIASGDLVSVRVFNQESMSVRGRIRADGKIAMPFLGDVELRGRTPAAASKDLAARLREFIVSPVVTVSVEEPRATTVSVLGEVAHPGVYSLDVAAGVLQALAAAGGLTDYASRDSIFVVRRGSNSRIRFAFASLLHAGGRAAGFRLQPGDALVVE
jgi:polysaccharide export outer membrane protein